MWSMGSPEPMIGWIRAHIQATRVQIIDHIDHIVHI